MAEGIHLARLSVIAKAGADYAHPAVNEETE